MVPRLMVVVTCLAVATAATACGDDGTNDDKVTVAGKPYVEAMTTSLADHGASGIDLSVTEARCIAPKWVNILDPDQMSQASVEPSQLEPDQGLDDKAAEVALSDAEIAKLVDAFGECDVDLTRSFVRSLTQGATLTENDETCLVDAVPDDLVRRMVSVEITKGTDASDDDPELMAELFEALGTCPGAIDLGR